MRTLTGMGGLGNAQELAELLRQMGRGPDTMLAHITPEEAQMLLESGGSGKINPQTGLPEFQPDYNYDVEAQEGGFYGQMPDFNYDVEAQPGGFYGEMPQQPQFNYDVEAQPGGFYGQMPQAPVPLQREFVAGQTPIPMLTAPAVDRYSMGRGQLPYGPVTPVDTRNIVPTPTTQDRGQPATGVTQEQQASFRQRYPVLSQALGTGIASLPPAYFARRARREGRGAEAELRAMAQPIREQAEALRQQALSGGLTPQQARQMEARRAQLRQSAAGRGATTGTQAAMIENTLGRERAGLAQTNLENAMRQLNLANTVTESAIRARLTSDREVDRYLNNIYTNLIRSSYGQSAAPMSNQPTTNMFPDKPIFTEPSSQSDRR